MNLLWRHSAEIQQLQYLKNISPQAAKRMRARIKQRLARLKHAPLTGRPSRGEDVRELIIAGTPYVVVYEVHAEVIAILQFFHMSQNRPSSEN
jgi:toxin ParE1/3/4